MEIVQGTVKKLSLTGLDALDPITVFIEDYEPGKGKITFECFGKSWSYYWGGMGSKGISEFFLSCNVAYLVNCLWDHSLPTSEPDFDGLTVSVKEYVIEQRREGLIDSSSARELYDIEDWSEYAPEHCYAEWNCPNGLDNDVFGDLWFVQDNEVPTRSTSDYCYLARLIEAIREAFKQLNKKE